MIEIPLTQGKVAIVDDEDAELARFKWRALRGTRTFYAQRHLQRIDGRQPGEYLHHAIWARAHPGEPLPPELDHWDGDGLNCRKRNLRAATKSSNMHNMRMRSNNTSGFKGAHWDKQHNRWKASIRSPGHQWHLGLFATREQAARAYDDVARKLHGEFACVNFPRPGERSARNLPGALS